MNWKVKAVAYHVFDKIPFGESLYFKTNKHITKSLPRRLQSFLSSQILAGEHIANFRQFFGDITKARLFEFGAGWDILNNLLMYCYGINDQLVLDRTPMARVEMINAAITRIRERALPEYVRLPEKFLTEDYVRELKEFYGIQYVAPGDAQSVPVPDGSVDLIATMSTLEHIPKGVLQNILSECFRISHKGSVMSMQISYNDHYSHTDSSITPYNYFRFGQREWQKFNPSIHYQNRLRASDFRKIFADAGFRILHETGSQPDNAETLLASVPVHSDFLTYSKDDLLKTYGNVICGKG